VAHYYAAYSWHVALGLVSDAELAAEEHAMEEQPAASHAGRFLAPMNNTSGNLPEIDPERGCCGSNSVYDVWLTNIVVWIGEEGGWNTSVAICGGTNGAVYDVFRTTEILAAQILELLVTQLIVSLEYQVVESAFRKNIPRQISRHLFRSVCKRA